MGKKSGGPPPEMGSQAQIPQQGVTQGGMTGAGQLSGAQPAADPSAGGPVWGTSTLGPQSGSLTTDQQSALSGGNTGGMLPGYAPPSAEMLAQRDAQLAASGGAPQMSAAQGLASPYGAQQKGGQMPPQYGAAQPAATQQFISQQSPQAQAQFNQALQQPQSFQQAMQGSGILGGGKSGAVPPQYGQPATAQYAPQQSSGGGKGGAMPPQYGGGAPQSKWGGPQWFNRGGGDRAYAQAMPQAQGQFAQAAQQAAQQAPMTQQAAQGPSWQLVDGQWQQQGS